jgi:hypothetical protein
VRKVEKEKICVWKRKEKERKKIKKRKEEKKKKERGMSRKIRSGMDQVKDK